MYLFHNVFLVIKDDTDPLLYAVVRENNTVYLPHSTFVAVSENSHHWRRIAENLGNDLGCYGEMKLRAVIYDNLSCSRNLVYNMLHTDIICSDHFQCMVHPDLDSNKRKHVQWSLEWIRADLSFARAYSGRHMSYIQRRILKELHDHLCHLPTINQVCRYHYPGHRQFMY